MKILKASSLALAVALAACGGGGSSNPEPSAKSKTGVFSDSAVAGINYQTSPGNRSGKTTPLGEYNYVEGDTVTFSIGDTRLPAVTATGRVTPADMADGNDADAVINVLRLLQTLDDDGNPDNGITISPQTQADFIGKAVEVNQPAAAFETEAQAAIGTVLVTAEEAEAHFAASQQADLRGSWLVLEGAASNRNVLSFLEGDRYILSHSYSNEDQGAATAEWGSYDWNPETGEITFTLIDESDGKGGLTWAGDGVEDDKVVTGGLVLAGDTLHFDLGEGDTFSASAIKDSDNPYVGGWYLPEEEGAFNVLTILDDTHYTIAHNRNQESYGNSEPVEISSEWGTYELNGESFDPIATQETDGDGGLYNAEIVDQISGAYYTHSLKRWGELDFTEHHPDIGDNDFSMMRVGRFPVTLISGGDPLSSIFIERDPDSAVGSGAGSWTIETASSAWNDAANDGDPVMLTLNLNENGTGTIEYGPEDVNYVDWEINSAGALVFTETDGSGDSWNWAVANTLGEGRVLISVLSPEGQADVGNDVMEAVLTENPQPAVEAQ